MEACGWVTRGDNCWINEITLEAAAYVGINTFGNSLLTISVSLPPPSTFCLYLRVLNSLYGWEINTKSSKHCDYYIINLYWRRKLWGEEEEAGIVVHLITAPKWLQRWFDCSAVSKQNIMAVTEFDDWNIGTEKQIFFSCFPKNWWLLFLLSVKASSTRVSSCSLGDM